jgi:hypothetical protein
VDVGDVVLDLAARADRPDRIALADLIAPARRSSAQMRQRDRVAVGGLDREAFPARRDRPREGNRSCGRRENGCSGWSTDVDAPVLAGRIRIVAEDERLEHRPVDRPGPGMCRGRDDKGRDSRDDS